MFLPSTLEVAVMREPSAANVQVKFEVPMFVLLGPFAEPRIRSSISSVHIFCPTD